MCRKGAELFKILGVESRIRIIDLLKNRGPLHVTEIAEQLGITPSAVSQHLKILRSAGLVRNRRQGFWIPYEVNPVALGHCRDIISEICNCGCQESCKGEHLGGEEDTDPAEEEIAYLLRLEQELNEELQRVRERIAAVKGES